MKSAIFAVLFSVSSAYQIFTMADPENIVTRGPQGKPIMLGDVLDKDVAGAPGSIQVFFNTTSVSSILMYLGLLVPDQAFNNKTIAVDIEQPIAEFTFSMTELTIETVTVGISSATFIEDSDTLRITIPNVTVNMTTDAHVSGPLIPDVKVKYMSIEDVTLQVDIASTSVDGIAYQLQSAAILSVGDVNMKTGFLYQHILDGLKPEFMKVLTYSTKLAAGIYEGAIDALNVKLANNNEFMIDVLGMPLNITMTRAPLINQEQQVIELHMDGLFNSDDSRASVPANVIEAVRESMDQREQIWMHQSTLGSALYALGTKSIMSEGINTQLVTLVHELVTYYGAEVECAVDITVQQDGSGEPVRILKDQGVLLGDETAGGLPITAGFMCSNATNAEKELAIELDLGISLRLNATFDNYQFWAEVADLKVQNSVATSHIGELEFHAWDDIFTALANDFITEFNNAHATPVDLKEKYTVVGFVAGITRATLLSPFVTDEFLFAGFKWITDK